jgi:CRP-like cAMP-binding protein
MQFLKSIPHPDFKHLPRNALIRICDQLDPISCIRGSTIFAQDEPFQYIYFITEGEF